MPKRASVFFVMLPMLALLLPAVPAHAQDIEMVRKKCVEFGFKDKTANHESCVKQLLQSTGGGKAPSKPAAAPAVPAVSPMQREDKFWDDAKAAGNKEAFEAYLASYPNGAYAGLARANIKRFVEAGDAAPKPDASIARSVEQWIEDPRSGCKVFNNEPQPNENITYVGGCSNGLAQGAGVVTWYKDAKFNEKGDGFWHRGKMNGSGSYEWAIGNKYVGDFVDGKRTGKGTFTWVNGDKYVGDYVDDKRTGNGRFTWADGSSYSGGFNDGELDGEGIYYLANGKVFEEGFWQKGKLIRAYKLK